MNGIQHLMQHKRSKTIFLIGLISFTASALLQMVNRCPLFNLENRMLDFFQGFTLGLAMPPLLTSLVFVVVSRTRIGTK